jgi:hypothetical protein
MFMLIDEILHNNGSDLKRNMKFYEFILQMKYFPPGKRAPSMTKMGECLRLAGFEHVVFEPLQHPILYDPHLYNNPVNYLDIDNFSRSDSTFSLCPPGEWEKGVERIRKMKEAGELERWFEQKEEERKRCGGQTINVYAVKPDDDGVKAYDDAVKYAVRPYTVCQPFDSESEVECQWCGFK